MEDQAEDAWGFTGEKAECTACKGTATVDGEICQGCLGYGWISTRKVKD